MVCGNLHAVFRVKFDEHAEDDTLDASVLSGRLGRTYSLRT